MADEFDVDLAAVLIASVEADVDPSLQPSPHLRAAMLEEARRRRPVGRWCGRVEDIAPVEAYRRAVAQLDQLVADLSPLEWNRPARREWTVKALLAHLVGADQYTGATLGLWPHSVPPDPPPTHLAATSPAIAELDRQPPVEVVRRWRQGANRITRHVDNGQAPMSDRIDFYGARFPLADVLVIRAFEVWAHTEDIATAAGRPGPSLEAGRLALMTELAVRLLPFGLQLAQQTAAGRTARLVLTGPGGGTWDQALAMGETPGIPDLVVVVDAIDYCRHAAHGHLAPDELNVAEGDRSIVPKLLAGASAFAE